MFPVSGVLVIIYLLYTLNQHKHLLESVKPDLIRSMNEFRNKLDPSTAYKSAVVLGFGYLIPKRSLSYPVRDMK